MPSKLSKVHKQVAKKKGDKIKSLHEDSRDAKRLRNAGARDDRVARLSAVREKINRQWLDRVVFFQDRLPETLHPMQTDEILALVKQFIERNDTELSELKADRRPGRPASTRQTLLEQQKKQEQGEFESGFWLPNLQDEETLVKLDKWTGDWVGLGVMRFVRAGRQGLLKDSQFPPRGAS